MKRALLVTAGTAVGLGAALSYTPSAALSSPTASPEASTAPAASPATAPASAAVAGAEAPAGAAAQPTPTTVTGPAVATKYGDLQVAITVDQGRLTDVTALAFPAADPKSTSISEQTIPLLREETLAAQSAEVATISGATFTTEAWKTSVAQALAEAGL